MGASYVTYADLFTYTIVLVTVISATAGVVYKVCKWFYTERKKKDHGKKKK